MQNKCNVCKCVQLGKSSATTLMQNMTILQKIAKFKNIYDEDWNVSKNKTKIRLNKDQ